MNIFSRRTLLAGPLSAGLAGSALAQAEGCGNQPNTAPALQPPLLLTDWAWIGRYRDDNAKLLAGGTKVRTVFLGDSITEGWTSSVPEFFTDGIVGRGISAQTTPQMLVRMHSDVVQLKPQVVHIMAGTNDTAGNTGPMTPEDTQNNIMAMCEIARAHRIRVVLASIPPASKYGWKPALDPRPAVLALNAWIARYARETGARFADYAAALSDGQGGVNLALAKDEVHPTAAGYAAMRPLAEAAIR